MKSGTRRNAGDRPWAGLRHAQIVATKVRGLPAGELQWPSGSHKVLKVGTAKLLLTVVAMCSATVAAPISAEVNGQMMWHKA